MIQNMGKVGQVGVIEVDALTSQVIPLSIEQNRAIQEGARDLATRYAPEAAPAI
jgi:hypothetical protein